MTGREQATFIHSLARMEMTDVLLAIRDQINLALNKAVDEIVPESARSILQAHMFCDLMDEEGFINSDLCEKLANKIAITTSRNSHLQNRVKDHLPSGSAIFEEYPLYQVFNRNIRPVDLMVENDGVRFFIEIDGPYHFLNNGEVNIQTEQRNHINRLTINKLEGVNQYITLNYHEIDSRNKPDLKSYLSSLLTLQKLIPSGITDTKLSELEDDRKPDVLYAPEFAIKAQEVESIEDIFAKIITAPNPKFIKRALSSLEKSARLNELGSSGNGIIHLCAR